MCLLGRRKGKLERWSHFPMTTCIIYTCISNSQKRGSHSAKVIETWEKTSSLYSCYCYHFAIVVITTPPLVFLTLHPVIIRGKVSESLTIACS
jgi:hypothetical protein